MEKTNYTLLKWTIKVLLVLVIINSGEPVKAQNSKNLKAHFSNSPLWWQTSICLPDDPFKTLVGREGELLYDYEGTFYESATGGFKTTVGINIENSEKWVNQELENPAVPVVKTSYKSANFEIVQEAFAQVSPTSFFEAEKALRLIRLDKGGASNNWNNNPGLPDWAKFAATNSGDAIHYQFKPDFSETSFFLNEITVALAFAPSKSGQNKPASMIIEAEGSDKKNINIAEDFGNKPGIVLLTAKDVNRDGRIDVRVCPNEKTQNQQIYLNTFWAFPADEKVTEKEILENKIPKNNFTAKLANVQSKNSINRNDVILVTLKNTSAESLEISPEIILKSEMNVNMKLNDGEIFIDNSRLSASLKMQSAREIVPKKWLIKLEPIAFKPGQSKSFGVVCQIGNDQPENHFTVEQLIASKNEVETFWTQESNIPLGKIQVPDKTIQSLIESSIRNIWQARDIKRGVPVFQVGPTIYRGLWVVDGAFLLETATLLGATAEARNSIEYTLNQQKENGAFQLLSPQYYKENGIMIWTAIRHALLSQDKKWLETNWNKIQDAFSYILKIREEASEDSQAPWFGINNPGEIDGGLSGHETFFQYGEYSNAYWNLTGMKAAIFAAHWLGNEKEAKTWQKQYDDFYNQVRKTMKRDMRNDAAGNSYLPIFMENATNASPQKAQWSFCQAVYPGQIFEQNDPLVAGNLNMLQNTEQEGMVVGTGWDDEGIWNYFASFYGHAWLWQGNGEKAAECLYAMANHASPTLVWREEHNTNDNAYNFVGDMPHNWASAEFVRLTSHLLAIDRGNELHLLEGFTRQWAKPGMHTSLNGIATPFGNLNLKVTVDDSGKQATINVKKMDDGDLKKIVIHLKGLTGKDETIDFDGKHDINQTITL